MPKAIWNGTVIAESEDTVVVDSNHYFPPDSLHREYLRESQHETVCNWKGTANYYDIVVDGQTNPQAAWYYATPKEEAKHIGSYVAFWKGVEVQS